MKGTNWTSDFYYYHNNYFFETDSSGYFERGQLAWSTPIDTLSLNISGNHIIYDSPEPFHYQILDSLLILEDINASDEKSEPNDWVFHFRADRRDWISEYEFTYGKELLTQGERIEILNFLIKE